MRRTTGNDTEWMADAFCKGMDPATFFPDDTVSTRIKSIREEEARNTCGECVVRLACLNYALANGIKDGIWGGTDEIERRSIIRRRVILNRRQASTGV